MLVDGHFQVSLLDIKIIFFLEYGRLQLLFQPECLSLQVLLFYCMILLFLLDLDKTALDFFVLLLHRFQLFLQRRDL